MLLRLNIRTCVLSKVLRPINLGKNLDCMFLVFLQQVSRLEMQRFQELSLRSLANMHHHDKRVWRRIKRLEQNIRLVAHAVVLSQIEESKSRVLIKKINQELQALKGAVKNSYIWHVCKMKKKMFSGFNLKITTHQCKVFFSVDSKMFSSI